MASVDLSDGRLELGIGAGWWKLEHDQAGIPFEPPGRRIDRLAEAIQVSHQQLLRSYWNWSGIVELDEHDRFLLPVPMPVPARPPSTSPASPPRLIRDGGSPRGARG